MAMSFYHCAPGCRRREYRRGPSPVIPLLLVVALLYMIYNELVWEWYDRAVSIRESLGGSGTVLVVTTAFMVALLMLSCRSDVMLIIPLVFLLLVFMMQNAVVTVVVLVPVIYIVGVYYYTPWGSSGGAGAYCCDNVGSGRFGLGFYAALMTCLLLCTLYSAGEDDREGCWWISFVLLLASLLFFNLYSGAGAGGRFGYMSKAWQRVAQAF